MFFSDPIACIHHFISYHRHIESIKHTLKCQKMELFTKYLVLQMTQPGMLTGFTAYYIISSINTLITKSSNDCGLLILPMFCPPLTR